MMIVLATSLSLLSQAAMAAEPWEQPLNAMPLPAAAPELNQTNCVELMLGSFRSNDIVKGLVFMPGATDELYFFKRVHVTLTNAAPVLLDAVRALTCHTRIHATFHPPLLLLHTDEDALLPLMQVENEALAQKLRCRPFLPHAVYNDRDWDVIQPILRKTLKADILPSKASPDSWHFYRYSFAAWNLNGWESLEAVLLAGKTTCKIQKQGGLSFRRMVIFFELDKRVIPQSGHSDRNQDEKAHL